MSLGGLEGMVVARRWRRETDDVVVGHRKNILKVKMKLWMDSL